MKKQSILTLTVFVAVLMLASCNKYEAKTSTLKTQEDSLNYTIGLYNGDGIKNYYFKGDSTAKTLASFMKAFDKAYNGNDKGEIYKLGVQIGNSLKMQKAKGLMGDSTLKFNEKLILQGLVNALSGYEKGMTPAQAKDFLDKALMKIQVERMRQQAPQQSQPDSLHQVPQSTK
jgi:hypothetical protein